ncbi:hypothetical protein D9619_011675 [Psilocybe cf. subviscida]|uniref:Uncharacterized protein n=1 Tax=Psilocybe cf. subviscida TaxID=2480587 RepID=A0A8H5BUL4_9AGAR|nr:hypothetical protein D9619_011675 [Psilocybe cf. subviscida]
MSWPELDIDCQTSTPSMPSSRQNLKRTSRTKPYDRSSSQRTQRTHPEKPPSKYVEPLRPPLPLGQDTMVDLARECVQKRFPNFVPRNSLDIINLAGLAYEGLTDQASICAYLDIMQQSYVPHLMEKHNCTAEQAARAIGLRQGQKFWVHIMPPWPKYTLRLWVSSADVRIFGMDFILSSTGKPIDLSREFHLYSTANTFGASPSRIGPFEPFALPWAYNALPQADSEFYYLLEEQIVVIREVTTRIGMSFRVPKHPTTARNEYPPILVDFSLDDSYLQMLVEATLFRSQFFKDPPHKPARASNQRLFLRARQPPFPGSRPPAAVKKNLLLGNFCVDWFPQPMGSYEKRPFVQFFEKHLGLESMTLSQCTITPVLFTLNMFTPEKDTTFT